MYLGVSWLYLCNQVIKGDEYAKSISLAYPDRAGGVAAGRACSGCPLYQPCGPRARERRPDNHALSANRSTRRDDSGEWAGLRGQHSGFAVSWKRQWYLAWHCY